LKALVSNDRLWKLTARLLGLSVDKLPYYLGPVVTSGYKMEVGSRVRELKACIATAEPVLDCKVKTAAEFDAAMINGANQETLIVELNQKRQLHERLSKGMWAHLFLRRIGMSTFQKMEQYATVLESNYKQSKTWAFIANEHVREGHFEKVIEIIDTHLNKLNDRSERDMLFNSLISHFSEAGDFKSTIAHLKKMRSYTTLDLEDREGPNIILCCAKEKGNFAVVLEMLTEGVIPEIDRVSNILGLIEMHIEKGENQKAHALVQQFAVELEEKSNEFQIHVLIRIYVALGNNEKAWDLARTHQEKDDLAFAILRNAFTSKGLLTEAEKAQALIKKQLNKFS
jgi:hypothetical protein